MNGNFGRDKVWTPEIWAEIDKAVLAEVGRIRVAQKVFPTRTMAGAQHVIDERLDCENMTIDQSHSKPFIEISADFVLSQPQVNNEATLHTGQSMARLAAKTVAVIEDEVIFQGNTEKKPPHVLLLNAPDPEQSLLGLATKVTPEAEPSTDGKAILDLVVRGFTRLSDAVQPGPYALVLENSLYGEAHSPIGESLSTAADRLTSQLTGGFYGTTSLPERIGLLASLGGEPLTLYVSQDVITAFTHQDEKGSYHFRVFEQIQFVARDPSALVCLILPER